jgi:hypothetical protein
VASLAQAPALTVAALVRQVRLRPGVATANSERQTDVDLLCRKPMLVMLAKQGDLEIRIYDGWQQPANHRARFS